MSIAEIHYKFLNSTGVSTDTRTLTSGQIFFALSGDNFNGNEYVQQALDKGAAFAVIDDKKVFDAEDKRMILVKDVLKTLQSLANYHKNYLGIPIIALTGSNGKTTTKNLIYLVLSQQYNVKATVGNFNNHIGVPLTLLSFGEEHDFGIVEMGANHPGEIDELCKIAEPSFGYVTNFGKAHLEGFGSVEGVVKAKSELYRYLAANRGVVFAYKNDDKQLQLTSNQERILFESGEDDSFDYELLAVQPKLKFRNKENIVLTHLVGAYNFTNCIAALAIGEYFGVSKEKAIRAIATYEPDNNRSQILKTDKNILLLDAYNANPTSIHAAIDSFVADTEHSKKVLILGDMFELGSYSAQEHQSVVELLEKNTSIQAYLVGENFNNTNSTSEHILLFKTREDLKQELKNTPIDNAYILLKGSRGMALESLVAYL